MRLHSPVAEAGPDPARAKVAAARRPLSASLVERGEEVDLVLTALLCGEHALLVGPPGCAKSLLLDALLAWCGGSKFSLLLTKYTTPEEAFGPVSLSALKEDKYLRVTTGRLPEADFAFLDEVFKASSAVLNTLLKVLNERAYDRGDGVARPVPLKLCVAASNEWPCPETGKELGAVFDRYLLRKAVAPVRSSAGRSRLLWDAGLAPSVGGSLSAAELAGARAAAAALPWSADAKEALEAVLRELSREGVRPGDRRQRRCVGAVRAFAYLSGADEVLPEHLEVAQHVLWDDPAEQPRKAAEVIARVAAPAGMRATQLLLEAEEVASACDARDLAGAAKAAAKLGEIDRQLAALKGDRAEGARGHVKEQLRRLKLASIEAV